MKYAYAAKALCALLCATTVGAAVVVIQHSKLPVPLPEPLPVALQTEIITMPFTTLQDTTHSAADPASTTAITTTRVMTTQLTTAKLIDFAKGKDNKITKDPKYRVDPAKEKDEDPQYRSSAPPETTRATTAAATTLPPTTVASTTREFTATTEQSSGEPNLSGTSAQETTARETTTAKPALQNGWYSVDEKRYYYRSGMALTGHQTIDSRKYFFEADGVLSSKVGIDVSKWNGNIDWLAVKAAGVDYVMIRVGYRGYGKAGNIVLDECFKQNILGAHAAGLDCGVYFYTQAITAAEAREEATFVLAAIEGFPLTYPIAYDLEDAGDTARTKNLSNAQRTDFALAFCDTIKTAGQRAVYYINLDWLTRIVAVDRLADYDLWLAHYTPGMTSCTRSYRMWQYSSKGRVNGINGDVDLNIGLYDYAADKKTQETTTAPKETTTVKK